MLLIIILILSQDKGFSQNIQGVMLGSVPWYKERVLHKTSLGTLTRILLHVSTDVSTEQPPQWMVQVGQQLCKVAAK